MDIHQGDAWGTSKCPCPCPGYQEKQGRHKTLLLLKRSTLTDLGQGEDHVHLVCQLRVVMPEDLEEGLAQEVVVFLEERLIYLEAESCWVPH